MALRSLHDALGLPGPASAEEIKAVYRSLAQRCRPEANPDSELLERLQLASIALGQELARAGYDEVFIHRALAEEGCPVEIATVVARASGGPYSRVVHTLERNACSPGDAAYARLAARTLATQAMQEASGSASYGLGFLVKLVIAFVLSCIVLYLALAAIPRALQSPVKAGDAIPGKRELPAMPVFPVQDAPAPRRVEAPAAAPKPEPPPR
jgi:hypothetical protein